MTDVQRPQPKFLFDNLGGAEYRARLRENLVSASLRGDTSDEPYRRAEKSARYWEHGQIHRNGSTLSPLTFEPRSNKRSARDPRTWDSIQRCLVSYERRLFLLIIRNKRHVIKRETMFGTRYEPTDQYDVTEEITVVESLGEMRRSERKVAQRHLDNQNLQ